VSADRVTLDVCRYDPVTQLLDENHVSITTDGITLDPISLRLAQPPEFDLMARIAGLRLRHRTGGWLDEPFTTTSSRHSSVYEPTATCHGAGVAHVIRSPLQSDDRPLLETDKRSHAIRRGRQMPAPARRQGLQRAMQGDPVSAQIRVSQRCSPDVPQLRLPGAPAPTSAPWLDLPP
jgi:hypothetical protein